MFSCLVELISCFIFQFHKGAIGVTDIRKPQNLPVLFQFHKGAIGVAQANRISALPVAFQFHKGAIGVKAPL